MAMGPPRGQPRWEVGNHSLSLPTRAQHRDWGVRGDCLLRAHGREDRLPETRCPRGNRMNQTSRRKEWRLAKPFRHLWRGLRCVLTSCSSTPAQESPCLPPFPDQYPEPDSLGATALRCQPQKGQLFPGSQSIKNWALETSQALNPNFTFMS